MRPLSRNPARWRMNKLLGGSVELRVEDIFWHDCVIVRVVESPTRKVAFQVEYPENWEADHYEDKTILFSDVYSYEIHEGPFHGPITILAASEKSVANETRLLRLETNAGYRELRFKTLNLVSGHVAT